MTSRYGRDALLRRDGKTYGSPRNRHRVAEGRGVVRVEIGRYTAWYRGNGVKQAIEATGCRFMWDYQHRAWSTPISAIRLVCDYLELHGRCVEIEERYR